MATESSSSSNPVFKTPQPEELKSEESKATVREQLSEQSEPQLDQEQAGVSNPADPATLSNDSDDINGQHILKIDSPPG